MQTKGAPILVFWDIFWLYSSLFVIFSERNREHAKRSRLRKKGITAQLQDSVIQLKEENEKLRNLIYAKIDKAKTDAMVNEKIISPTDKFLKALQKPSNRVIHHDTLSFLQSLSASCQIGKWTGYRYLVGRAQPTVYYYFFASQLSNRTTPWTYS
jgi:hypothetical protein